MKMHKYKHTKNLVKGHNGILYEVLPKGSLFKYRMLEDYSFDTQIIPKKSIKYGFVELKTTGRCYLRTGFNWDGATGMKDTLHNMRASACHDALFSLIIGDLLGIEHLEKINDIFTMHCLDDKMKPWKAKFANKVLDLFGDNHIRKCLAKRTHTTTVTKTGKEIS